MKLTKISKLLRLATSTEESLRGVDWNAFKSIEKAVSYIKSAAISERKRLKSNPRRDTTLGDIKKVYGI